MNEGKANMTQLTDKVLRKPRKPLPENVCEHGDHPAPVGKRYCSVECEECDNTPQTSHNCANICGLRRSAPGYGLSLAPVTEPAATNCVFFDVKESSLVVVGE